MQALPLRIASDTDRQVIVGAFRDAAFDERHVSDRLGLPNLTTVGSKHVKGLTAHVGDDQLALLIRLFVLHETLDASEVARFLSPPMLEACLRTDLVRPYRQSLDAPGATAQADGQPGQQFDVLFSPVALVPVKMPTPGRPDAWIACDRLVLPDGTRIRAFADVVFSGHNPLTREFLHFLPRSWVESTLELGAGTGVAAIASASCSSAVVATDIAPRSVHFGRFNVWLNGCANIEWQAGDLYGAVPGRTFQRVVAHPPYVATLAPRAIYRDGGTTGEQILQGVVAGIPGHLAPGGEFMMLGIGLDMTGAPFEQRARGWLGEASEEFDLVFGLQEEQSPEAYAERLVERADDAPPEDFPRWRQLFADLEVSAVVYGLLAGRRRTRIDGPAATRRVRISDATTYDAFEWLFGWLDGQRQPGHLERVLTAVPRLSPALRLTVSHHPESGELVPYDFLVHAEEPFPVQARIDVQMARLLSAVDGTRTGRELAALSAGGESPDEEAAARAIAHLVERGLLLLD